MIAHKTKAAMQGRPSHHIKAKQDQHTRPYAGGQSLTTPGMAGAQLFKSCANIKHHSLAASLACLRCRRLISPLIEATTKPAVLSPSSFTFSSSPINSNGTLETICCDLLFLEPVAMSVFPSDWWHSVYAKRKHNQYLKVAFTLFYRKCMPPVMVKHKWQRPGVLGTTTEASNQKRYQR